MFWHTFIAVACTTMLMDIYLGPTRRKGPVPPPIRAVHPVEMTVAQIIEAPLFPARIDPRPHPLWLGLRFNAPPAPEGGTGGDGQPKRIPLAELMATVASATGAAAHLGFPLGDAAHKLGGATAVFSPPEHWWLLSEERKRD